MLASRAKPPSDRRSPALPQLEYGTSRSVGLSQSAFSMTKSARRVGVQFVAMQEQPVEDKHRAGCGDDLGQLELPVGSHVVDGRAVPPRPARTERAERLAPHEVIVEGVQPESGRRVPARPVSLGARSVEIIH